MCRFESATAIGRNDTILSIIINTFNHVHHFRVDTLLNEIYPQCIPVYCIESSLVVNENTPYPRLFIILFWMMACNKKIIWYSQNPLKFIALKWFLPCVIHLYPSSVLNQHRTNTYLFVTKWMVDSHAIACLHLLS